MREGLVDQEPKAGINKTAVVLALIAMAQAVLLALVGTGQVAFGAGSDKSAPDQHLPPAVSADGIELKQTSPLSPEECVRGSQRALLAKGFRAWARTDRTITMTQGDAVVWVRCRNDAIVLSAAGPNGGNMDGAVAEMRSAIREELSGDVRVE